MKESTQTTAFTNIISGKKVAFENEFIRWDKLSALIIDDIGAMRHALRSQLHWMGLNQVKCVSTADEAVRQVVNNRYDLILCDYNLNMASSGQHFLEHLRHERLLSAKTLFVMVTGETEYAFVANAVEFIPDDYILKPCPEIKLRSRLEKLFDRRNFLLTALSAMDEQNYDKVIRECDVLMTKVTNERWILAALKLKAEAQVAKGDTSNLLNTYDRALTMRDNLPWVKLGIARTRLQQNNLESAEQSAQEIISDNPNYVASYELMADIKRIQKDEEGAYKLMAQSVKILPTAKRYRSTAESAFLLGKLEEARTFSEAAIKLSGGSMTERVDDYLTLAQVQIDLGENQAAIRTLEKSAQKFEEKGAFSISKNAILAQAYFSVGDKVAANKLLDRSQRLINRNSSSAAMNFLGKAAFKLGDPILGLKMLTRAIQSSGEDRQRIERHVTKSMIDTGHGDKIEEVIDAGLKRIITLVEESQKLMHVAQFETAFAKILEALDIQEDNVQVLLAAAQLHLLWLKREGMVNEVDERAKTYLATLDKLVPKNEKVMGFYRFYEQLKDQYA